MPKRLSAEAETKSAPARLAPKSKATAAIHKRAVKQPIPTPSITSEQIAQFAYSLWEARGHHGGSPEDDWFRAERELLELAQNR